MKRILKSIYSIIPLKKYIFQLIRPFQIPKSIYQHLYFKDQFKVKFNNYQFLIEHHGYQIENEIFWSGLTQGWEKISIQLWIELCKDANVIIDIGANTGIYSLVAQAVNPTASVYGFEPVDRVYQKFQRNCDLNGFDIKCNNYAISNYDGEATIYDTPSEHVLSVTVNKNTLGYEANIIETKIKTKKLSTFIKETGLQRVDLMKIDVETHEPETLEGMENFLIAFQPTILIEVLNDEIGKRIQNIIKDMDYLFFNIDEINIPKKIDHIVKSDHYNYLICRENIARKLNLI